MPGHGPVYDYAMNEQRDKIIAVKRQLADGFDELKQRHADGCTGEELCRDITAVRDRAVLELLNRTLKDIYGDNRGILKHAAVVAHGGYGRCDLAPQSDVDIMLLHSPSAGEQVAPLAKRMVCDIFDAGMKLGHSVRSPRQAVRLAAGDPSILTSLIESRLLMGEKCLLDDMNEQLAVHAKQHSRAAIAAVDASRSRERNEYGDTVFLLEPNVKRSPGGLRDLQMVRWIGYLRYGTRKYDELVDLGALSADDYATLTAAREFLLRLRNDLHFSAYGTHDVLTREQQLRIAAGYGAESSPRENFQAADGMLPVERFMREYFRHTAGAAHVAASFLAKAQSRDRMAEFASAVFGHRVEGGLRVGISGLTVERRGLELLKGNLTEIMRLVSLSNLYDKPIAPATWEAVRRSASRLPDTLPASACLRFMSLLEHPARLGRILRDLHDIGILERFIPEYAHARGLLQFNAYHKYTVDEHSLRALEFAVGLSSDEGLFGQTYRRIKQKNILHLAILIHDLGKGMPGDHRETAREIAKRTAKRLGLKAGDAEILEFLAANHDMMNHTAFRRDCLDERLQVDFATKVGSLEVLRMLFILTAADMSAVGPGSWDGWKSDILVELFEGTTLHLSGEAATRPMIDALTRRRDAVRRALGSKAEHPWFERQLGQLPADYITAADPRFVADDLVLLRNLGAEQAAAAAAYAAESQTVQITVGMSGQISHGAFHKLTGALSGLGLEIRSAGIHDLADGLSLDRFCTHDGDYAGKPPDDRMNEIERALVEALQASEFTPKAFRHPRRLYGARGNHGQQVGRHTANSQQVLIDNTTSQDYTIIDVFAADRPGLLYEISRELFNLGLSVARAKISTHQDQVVDVFYVTYNNGGKVGDEPFLQAVRERLLEVARELATD